MVSSHLKKTGLLQTSTWSIATSIANLKISIRWGELLHGDRLIESITQRRSPACVRCWECVFLRTRPMAMNSNEVNSFWILCIIIGKLEATAMAKTQNGILHVLLGIDAIYLAGHTDRVEDRADFRAFNASIEQKILSTKNQASNDIFGGVIVQRNRWVFEEFGQCNPIIHHVVDRKLRTPTFEAGS